MSKQRKHDSPSGWQKEDSGEMQHPHREVKIIHEKKVGLDPVTLDDQEKETGSSKNDSAKKSNK
ncbi:hypothetical protein HYX58_01920 [Candidatus Dependentiae bacterium]|nr:hypothetical protein [Candidatus Dependentiae bacterium]